MYQILWIVIWCLWFLLCIMDALNSSKKVNFCLCNSCIARWHMGRLYKYDGLEFFEYYFMHNPNIRKWILEIHLHPSQTREIYFKHIFQITTKQLENTFLSEKYFCWGLKNSQYQAQRNKRKGATKKREEISPKGLKPKRSIKKEKGKPRSLWDKKKEKEKKPMSEDWRKLSRDPQTPPKGSDPPRRVSTVNKRLGQFERKGKKETQENRGDATSFSSAKRSSKKRGKNQRPLMAQVGSAVGNQNEEV